MKRIGIIANCEKERAKDVLASLFSSKKIIAPIKRLTKAISDVASSKTPANVKKYHITELDSMVESFNEMVHKLATTTFSKEYLDNILNSLQESLFVVSHDGTIITRPALTGLTR